MHIDYYLAPQSPWTYLGHDRLVALLNKYSASVRVLPMDLGQIFPVSGGLPLPKRAPQRQAYRLVELKRFSEALAVPLNFQPKFFPVQGDDAARLITCVAAHDGPETALRLAGGILKAVWAQERNIADATTLSQLLDEAAVPTARLLEAATPAVQAAYAANTQAAIDLGVFGSPSYVVGGEIFWGQDRLDMLERKLRS
jgi:2-hydroxychromene-2-carboxylate isomerase